MSTGPPGWRFASRETTPACPTGPGVFEKVYGTEQLEAASRIPRHIRFAASKVWPKEDGSPTPALAVTTPEASTFFEAMARLSTGGVRVLMSDVEVPAG